MRRPRQLITTGCDNILMLSRIRISTLKVLSQGSEVFGMNILRDASGMKSLSNVSVSHTGYVVIEISYVWRRTIRVALQHGWSR